MVTIVTVIVAVVNIVILSLYTKLLDLCKNLLQHQFCTD